jgi:hypothetical protein
MALPQMVPNIISESPWMAATVAMATSGMAAPAIWIKLVYDQAGKHNNNKRQ